MQNVPGLQQWSYRVNAFRSISCSPTVAGDSWVIGAQLDEVVPSAKGREKE